MPDTMGRFIKGEHGPRWKTGERWKIKTCEICGQSFSGSEYKGKRTCSIKCRYLLQSKLTSHRLTRICVVCQKPFEIQPAWLRKGNTKGLYCSVSCRFRNKYLYTKKQKDSASQAIFRAIHSGKLIKQPCIVCNNPDSQAHHHKGYAKKYWLDIVWLCQKHHLEEEERLRRFGLNHLI